MKDSKSTLARHLEAYYRSCGWPVDMCDDGTVRATGLGGVTWIGLPVVPSDLVDPSFPEALQALSDERMPTGERCPLELLPEPECADDLRALLAELRLAGRGHVEIYAVAA